MQFSQILAKFAVSLFTREWIEIMIDIEGFRSYLVSLLQKNELTETNIIF